MTRRRRPIELPGSNWFHDPALDPFIRSRLLSREAEADRETAAFIPPLELKDLMANRARYEREKRRGRSSKSDY